MEAHFSKWDTCSFSDLSVETLTMHFEVLQNFFHRFITTDLAKAFNVRIGSTVNLLVGDSTRPY